MPAKRSRYSTPSTSQTCAPVTASESDCGRPVVGHHHGGPALRQVLIGAHGSTMRPDALGGEDLEQQRVRHPAVEDVRPRHAALDSAEARLHLGDHPRWSGSAASARGRPRAAG